jgi:hypothetical protein
MNICKICSSEFAQNKELHFHLRSHKITLADYYIKYFPRYNLLTGDPLPFKNKDQYFGKDFSSREQLMQWCDKEDEEVVKEYILQILKRRIDEKDLKFAPFHLELVVNDMPGVEMYQKYFKSYTYACKEINALPMFRSRLPKEWNDEVNPDTQIFIDTREQQPLEFKNSDLLKLDFGDYAVGGSDYDYTYVDRKSEQDFKSTLSKNSYDRFKSELQRARDFDSYLFILTESDLFNLEKNNKWAPHRSNMKYIYHNMRVLAHEFAGSCQFVFSGSREESERLIPKILTLGKKIWDVDLQYYIDNKLI